VPIQSARAPRPAKRRADPTTDFAIAEFRNNQRQAMLVVQEFCQILDPATEGPAL